VRGIAGLRVIDSSIFPTIPSSNTNIPTIATGEKGADLVLAAARDAQTKATALREERIGRVSGGLNLPGLF